MAIKRKEQAKQVEEFKKENCEVVEALQKMIAREGGKDFQQIFYPWLIEAIGIFKGDSISKKKYGVYRVLYLDLLSKYCKDHPCKDEKFPSLFDKLVSIKNTALKSTGKGIHIFTEAEMAYLKLLNQICMLLQKKDIPETKTNLNRYLGGQSESQELIKRSKGLIDYVLTVNPQRSSHP